MVGADGVQPAKAASEVTPEPADKSGDSQDCKEIDAGMHSVRMYLSGTIDAWRACYADDAQWTHNQWGANGPVDELADIYRTFHEAVEGRPDHELQLRVGEDEGRQEGRARLAQVPREGQDRGDRRALRSLHNADRRR